MQFHELANIFPMMNQEEFAQLAADIKANGLRESIWTFEGKIIDGRNRFRACRISGVQPRFREWKGEEPPIAFVLSQNLVRRHLSSSQKAVIALEVEKVLAEAAKERQVATLRKGTESPLVKELTNGSAEKPLVKELTKGLEQSPPVGAERKPESPTIKKEPPKPANEKKATQQAAQLTGTNRQYVSDAKKIERERPELIAPIREGKLTIPEAKAVAALPDELRTGVVEKISNGPVTSVKAITEQVISEKIDKGEIKIEANPHDAIRKAVKNDPEQKWLDGFNRAWEFLNGVSHFGGIGKFTVPWKPQSRRTFLDQLRSLAAQINQWIEKLEKEVEHES